MTHKIEMLEHPLTAVEMFTSPMWLKHMDKPEDLAAALLSTAPYADGLEDEQGSGRTGPPCTR